MQVFPNRIRVLSHGCLSLKGHIFKKLQLPHHHCVRLVLFVSHVVTEAQLKEMSTKIIMETKQPKGRKGKGKYPNYSVYLSFGFIFFFLQDFKHLVQQFNTQTFYHICSQLLYSSSYLGWTRCGTFQRQTRSTPKTLLYLNDDNSVMKN